MDEWLSYIAAGGGAELPEIRVVIYVITVFQIKNIDIDVRYLVIKIHLRK